MNIEQARERLKTLDAEVVIMVYDALKAARSRIVHLDTGNTCESPVTLETINQALSALDGVTPTNKPQ